MKLVRATIWTPGWAALIRAIAPIPSSWGMTMSMRIDVGDELGRQLDADQAVLGLADDLDVVEQLEVAAQPAPDDAMVVDEQDADARRVARVSHRCHLPPTRHAGAHRRAIAVSPLGDRDARGLMRSSAAAALEQDRRRQDRAATDDLDRRKRLVEQERGQGHADERFEEHQDAGPRPADRADPDEEQHRRDPRADDAGDRREPERVGVAERHVSEAPRVATASGHGASGIRSRTQPSPARAGPS